jgi:hypothetical protein
MAMDKRIETMLRGALAVLTLSGCAPLLRQPPPAGAPLAGVTAALGQPAAVYPEPGRRPGARIPRPADGPVPAHGAHRPDGKLVSYEQVLTSRELRGKVKVDHWTKDDILRHFGRPGRDLARGLP